MEGSAFLCGLEMRTQVCLPALVVTQELVSALPGAVAVSPSRDQPASRQLQRYLSSPKRRERLRSPTRCSSRSSAPEGCAAARARSFATSVSVRLRDPFTERGGTCHRDEPSHLFM